MKSSWLVRIATLALLLLPNAALALDLLLDTRVDQALADGNPAAARAEIEAALAEPGDPETTEALLRRFAELHLQLGNPLAAAETWERLAAAIAQRLGPTVPELASVWQAAGEAWQAAGDEIRALDAWFEALSVDAVNGIPITANPLYEAAGALIDDLPSQRERVRLAAQRSALRDLSASVNQPAPGPSPRDLGDPTTADGHSLIRIYYATNRARTENTRPGDLYAAGRGPLDYGTAEVSIPKIHRPGGLEAPSIFSFDVIEDPERHLILRRVDPAPKAAVFAQMRDHLATAGSNEAFVFVHGFNVSFSDAARRTAQIAHDMNFDGLPILYSWPSQGNMLGYLADGAVVQLSGRLLSGFLEDVVADTGATRIHLIAHSMGNRALTEALELFALRHAGEPPAFDQVLFTAPDLDAGLFANMVETIRPAVGRMTLYTSKNDWALRVSNQLNGGAPRAGEGAQGVFMPPVIDSIDMSVLGEDMLAHSYFADDTSALTDILSLFWRDAPPQRRCGMTPSLADATSAEWSLEPALCDGGAMLEALRLLRGERIGNLSDALAIIETQFPDADADRRSAIEAALQRLFQP